MSKAYLELGQNYSINDLERANERAGNCWFSPDTKRFFNSRILEDVITVADGWLFISSERQSMDHPRLFTVRHMDVLGEVSTVGEFQQYGTKARALSAAKLLAKGG